MRKLCIFLLLCLTLTACERQQQGTDTVTNKESITDFTSSATVQNADINKPAPPMLTGKAQVLGAEFPDFATQTGTAVVEPSQVQSTSTDQ